jgi:hypothetical protein
MRRPLKIVMVITAITDQAEEEDVNVTDLNPVLAAPVYDRA